MKLIGDMEKAKLKKIMLQGYLHVSNFGDVIIGHLFYQKCQELGLEEIDFFQFKDWGIGEDCRREFNYYAKKNVFQCLKADAFVLISGGSLWDDRRSRAFVMNRFFRFILPARLYQLMGKPVYILGVGGGPVKTRWLRRQMIKMLNKARIIQFRDEATKLVFENYGVNNIMTVTADTALVITKDVLPSFEQKEELDKIAGSRKKILFHYSDDEYSLEKIEKHILTALLMFLKEQSDYMVVVCSDNNRIRKNREKLIIKNIEQRMQDSNVDVYHYDYNESWQLCSLINEVDCIITSKLHVGVVACSLNKSVVSFPLHREKTQNFYAMIDESDRCIHLRNVTSEMAYNQLCRFHDKPVCISDELRNKAEMNLSILDEIVADRR